MSDKNNQWQPSNYGLARAYAKSGLNQSALKANDIAQKTASSTPTNVGIAAAQMALAGGKNYAKAASYAGKGFMEGVSKQNPNSGQQLNNMKINQSIAQGKAAATSTNKGIASFQNKVSGQSSSTSKSSTASKGYGADNSKGSSR